MGVTVENYAKGFYYPPPLPGLIRVVRFPGGELRRGKVPNSTVWVFNAECHRYLPEILGNDVGCGMAAFIIPEVDPREAAEALYAALKGKNILGRGGHFVDICSGIQSPHLDFEQPHHILVIHSDGKKTEHSPPQNIIEAQLRERAAAAFREELGHSLAERVLGVRCERIQDWPHNLVYPNNGHIVYNHGVIATIPRSVHLLPAGLGRKILMYTVDGNMPPHNAMPHAAGRKGDVQREAVPLEDIQALRTQTAIPRDISDAALAGEHPVHFNNHEVVLATLRDYIVPLGELEILAYVGKV